MTVSDETIDKIKSMDLDAAKEDKVCSVSWCDRTDKVCKIKKGGDKFYCGKHQHHIIRYGHIKSITLKSKNQIIKKKYYAEVVLRNKDCIEIGRALIDLEDIDRVKKHKWGIDHHNYVSSTIKNKKVRLHRFIMNSRKGQVIDHTNRNPLDNRKRNLRSVTQQINCFNTKITKNNTSGVVGVCFDKKSNKCHSYITKNRIAKNLGYFETFEEAVKARKKAELKYFGEVIER